MFEKLFRESFIEIVGVFFSGCEWIWEGVDRVSYKW